MLNSNKRNHPSI
jgi:hypothetical protein